MTKLVALIDGSIYSTSLCDHAAWAAARMGASVEILHVLGRRDISSAPVNLSGSIGLGARTALLQELAELDAQKAKLAQKRGRLVLDEAMARLRDDGITNVSSRLRIEDFVESILEAEKDASLIVIGKRGEAADFAKLHLGSNLERVIRAVHRPVLVASRGFRPIERLMIAFDGGASALKAVDHVATNAMFAGLDCRILSVGNETPDMRTRLEAASSRLRAAGLAVTAEIAPGHADAVIVDQVHSQKIDLLVMGAYGHSRIRTLVIGSTTSEVIRRCQVPVMLYR